MLPVRTRTDCPACKPRTRRFIVAAIIAKVVVWAARRGSAGRRPRERVQRALEGFRGPTRLPWPLGSYRAPERVQEGHRRSGLLPTCCRTNRLSSAWFGPAYGTVPAHGLRSKAPNSARDTGSPTRMNAKSVLPICGSHNRGLL